MYAYLKGIVSEISADNVVVEVGGIGYNVKISSQTASELPSVGSEVKIYTYTSVREDAILLFGFLTASDLQMFRQLITVNGIGPKGGLSILSAMNADAIRFAILTGDVNSLAKAPGIGKKSAERVILELKGKVDALDILSPSSQGQEKVSGNIAENAIVKDATEALTALGYSATDALKAIKNVVITEDMSVDTLLKLALKEMI